MDLKAKKFDAVELGIVAVGGAIIGGLGIKLLGGCPVNPAGRIQPQIPVWKKKHPLAAGFEMVFRPGMLPERSAGVNTNGTPAGFDIVFQASASYWIRREGWTGSAQDSRRYAADDRCWVASELVGQDGVELSAVGPCLRAPHSFLGFLTTSS